MASTPKTTQAGADHRALTRVAELPSVKGSNNRRSKVQMADLARMAGVSTSTVSRALSGSALIPESTRERIRELAQSLNYQVNVAAANLRKRDVQTVGVVVLGDSMQSISDPFILSLLGAVADSLDQRGMNLLLSRLDAERQATLGVMVDSGQVAGLIVIGQLTWHDYLNELARRHVPMAVWGAHLSDALYPVVGGDNERGGYLVGQHLVDQGCRRIAFFGDTSHPEAGLRYQGFVRALQERGMTSDPRLVQPFLYGDTRIRELIDQCLDRGLDFDAVFAASDITAMTVIGALRERGLDVPTQVKVVGYDDIVLSGYLHPAITSVRQPAGLAGRALVDLLFESIQGLPRRALTLPTELIARESTGAGDQAQA